MLSPDFGEEKKDGDNQDVFGQRSLSSGLGRMFETSYVGLKQLRTV
jgi:hypothetical protein